MSHLNKKVKITFVNHIRRGIIHGLVKDVKDGYIYLEQFTDDKMIIKIREKNVKEIFVL